MELPATEQITLETTIDEAAVQTLRMWDRRDRAKFYDVKAQQIEERERRNYVELGLVLVEVERGELFKELGDPWCFLCSAMVEWRNGVCVQCKAIQRPFHSFDRWLNVRAPVSSATGYRAKRAIESCLEAGLPIDQMMKIHRTNLNVLAQLSASVKVDPQVLRVAESQPENKLREHIEQAHPDQHIEREEKMILSPTHSARSIIDDAIRAAEGLYEIPSREEAVEHICGSWLVEPCGLEEYQGLNNLEAWERRRGK